MKKRMIGIALVAASLGSFGPACASPPPASSAGAKGTPRADVSVPVCRDVADGGSDEAPVLVLYERDPWLTVVGSDFPTVALWRDGSIVFMLRDGRRFATLQSTIAADQAIRAATHVAEVLQNLPEHTTLTNKTDQVTVEILVRNGDAWRAADVYGLERATVPEAPKGFMDAYTQLLGLRPDNGVPFQPVDILVLFWGFDYARGEPVPWPTGVPAPPTDAVPAERRPGDPVVYSFLMSPEHLPALRGALDATRTTQPERGIAFNGHKWAMQPIARFRGQETIERALRCARSAR